jgi:phosphate transport system permease protein
VTIPLEQASPFAPSRTFRARRRRVVDRSMRASATIAALAAVAMLAWVIVDVAQHGASAINGDFFTKAPPVFGTGGGILPEIVGTGLIVALATGFALPIGVLVAIFLSEFATPRWAYPIRLALDLLNGLPSIVIGVFVYGLLVLGSGQKGYAASIALAIIMVPLIARATQEVLRLVPQTQRDAAHALGISKWRTTVGVVLPACLSGILTGTVLAVARAAGETAPLLLLSSFYNPNQPVTFNVFGTSIPNIPIEIFTDAEQPDPASHARAWGAALVLVAIILLVSLVARYALARQRRKMYR